MKSLFKLSALSLILLTFDSEALEDRHMLTFGRRGIGWNNSAEKFNSQDSSALRNLTSWMVDLGLNYSYRFTNRFQLGFFYEHYQTELRFKNRDGGSSSMDFMNDELGIEAIYNFSDDLPSAWFTSLAFSFINLEEENSDKFTNAEGKGPFELDDHSYRTAIFVGKRWDLGNLKRADISFAPKFGLFYQTHAKDFNDQKATSGIGVNFEPLALISSFRILSEGIIRVSGGTFCIQRGEINFIQGKIFCKTLRQIWIGNEWQTKGNCISNSF